MSNVEVYFKQVKKVKCPLILTEVYLEGDLCGDYSSSYNRKFTEDNLFLNKLFLHQRNNSTRFTVQLPRITKRSFSCCLESG